MICGIDGSICNFNGLCGLHVTDPSPQGQDIRNKWAKKLIPGNGGRIEYKQISMIKARATVIRQSGNNESYEIEDGMLNSVENS